MLCGCPKCGKIFETTEELANAPMWGTGYWDHYCPECFNAFGREEREVYLARTPPPLTQYTSRSTG